MTPDLRRRADWLAHLFKAATQQHHRELGPVFAPLIAPDAVVLDVGAHAGQFAKLFARLAPRGRIYAFEPSAYARSILVRALAWNRVRNVEVAALGLSDADGEAVLHTPVKRRGGLGFGLANLAAAPGGAAGVDQTVPLITLDAFAEEHGLERVDFIKIDVEGWEAHVLRGAAQTLARHRPALFLEVIAASLGRAGETVDTLWRPLASLGYAARKAPGFEPTAGFSGDGDYLFTAR